MDYPPRWRYDLDRPGPNPSVADDDFDTGALAAKWSVEAGTLGTVSLLTSPLAGTYDLTSRRGWLLMQPIKDDSVRLRQAYTLPDGYSLVAAVAPAINCSGQAGISDSELDLGIILSDGGANFYTVHVDSEVEGWRVWCGWGGGAPSGTSLPPNKPLHSIAGVVYLRIARVGLVYSGFMSYDGHTWLPFTGWESPAELTQFDLWASVTDVIGAPAPIQAVNWVRVGGNGVQPW